MSMARAFLPLATLATPVLVRAWERSNGKHLGTVSADWYASDYAEQET